MFSSETAKPNVKLLIAM